MKRITLWSIGLLLVGVVLWWGFQGVGQATHRSASEGFNVNNTGFAQDETNDEEPSLPGRDRNIDHSPDRRINGSTTGLRRKPFIDDTNNPGSRGSVTWRRVEPPRDREAAHR